MIVDLILQSRIAGGIGARLTVQHIERPFGMIRRIQTRSTRDCPNATWLS
jgi:hypothetical protein